MLSEIVCARKDCKFNMGGDCSAATVEIGDDLMCKTYKAKNAPPAAPAPQGQPAPRTPPQPQARPEPTGEMTPEDLMALIG